MHFLFLHFHWILRNNSQCRLEEVSALNSITCRCSFNSKPSKKGFLDQFCTIPPHQSVSVNHYLLAVMMAQMSLSYDTSQSVEGQDRKTHFSYFFNLYLFTSVLWVTVLLRCPTWSHELLSWNSPAKCLNVLLNELFLWWLQSVHALRQQNNDGPSTIIHSWEEVLQCPFLVFLLKGSTFLNCSQTIFLGFVLTSCRIARCVLTVIFAGFLV